MDILLIEDNITIAKALKYSFDKNGYNLEFKTSLKEAKEYISNNKIDLVILDITLPDGNGFDFYETVIKNLSIPTVFLTAKDEEESIVRGLNIGAEDYITKPFSTKELLARVNKILLRSKKENIIKVKDITFDMDKMVVKKEDQNIELTSLELKLLNLLFFGIINIWSV